MGDELARLLRMYKPAEVLGEVWWNYRWVLALAAFWLCRVVFLLWRDRSEVPLVGRAEVKPPDAWTLPVVLVSLQAVWELWSSFEHADHFTPQGYLALQWYVSAASFVAVAGVLLLSTLAILVARLVLRVEVSVLPHVGLPGLLAVASLVGLHFLLSAVVHLGLVAGDG